MTKTKNITEKQNALFFQRVVAFIIDIMLISMVASFISFPFYDYESINNLNDAAVEINEKYFDKEIDTKTYLTESIDINYEMARKSGITSIVTLFLSVLYFVCYQFYSNGQTIGKKLMHIQVVKDDDSDLTINTMIFRSLIINSIFADMLVLCFVIFANKDIYFYGVGTIEILQSIILFISAIMVMFSKSSRGLHDLVAHTKVVRIDSVKELEVCEN